MLKSVYISRFVCGLLLIVFALSITPKQFLHDMFARHIDNRPKQNSNNPYQLANAGYNVAKYMPYGPVKDVLPYLIRRAMENTSVKGQTGRELALIIKEKRRRRS